MKERKLNVFVKLIDRFRMILRIYKNTREIGLEGRERQIKEMERKYKEMVQKVAEIQNKQEEIDKRAAWIREKKEEIQKKIKEIREREKVLTEKETHLKVWEETLTRREAELKKLYKTVKEKERSEGKNGLAENIRKREEAPLWRILLEEFKKEKKLNKRKEQEGLEKRQQVKVEEPTEKEKHKPYKKKFPTESTKTNGQKQQSFSHKGVDVDLGKRRPKKGIKKDSISKPSSQDKGEGKIPRPFIRVVAPFVELDLDEARVFLVIPKQIIPIPESTYRKQLNYEVKLNDRKEIFKANIAETRKYLEIEEKRIELEEPIQSFEVVFPPELGNRIYHYKHQDDFIYVFIAIDNNSGRMHYLYDTNGNTNPLPQKGVWILLKEDFRLGVEPKIEDIWIWENYQALYLSLKNVSKLVVTHKNRNQEKDFLCESSFFIDGQGVIHDDFGEQFPIFTGNSIEIKAPVVNEEGWRVWIQNKQAGYKIVSDNWSGKEPLKLNLDRDIPCECGEFQVDICEQNGESVTTLFFRYIPSLRLNYPKELIIPDSKKGHRIEVIEVSLRDPAHWEIETSQQIKSTQYGYEIDLPPEIDTLRFSISKEDKPETKTNFMVTIPRLKWRTSRQEEWTDKLFDLARKELITGEDFYFIVRPNTLKPCDFLIFLEAEGRELQQKKLDRKGKDYLSTLNQFYDTLKLYHTNVVMKLREVATLRKLEVINFLPPELACRLCSFTSYHKKQILSHVKEKHLCEFFEPLTFEELRKYDSSLPHKIYKCSYCGFYVKEDNLVNPTSAICNHIEKYCPKADRSKGPPRVRFEVISDADEIRRNVLPDLPNYQKCKICGKHITTPDVERLFEHLIKFHESELYIVKGE